MQAVFDNVPLDILSCLVRVLGANVNQQDEKGWTAFFMATHRGFGDLMRYLVEELGADTNIGENADQTPLCLAVVRGQRDVVRILLRLGADINRPGWYGATPLMMASHGKHQEIVRWLVKAGADTQTLFHDTTAADISYYGGAPSEQTAYLEAKTHCSNSGCSGAGMMKCTGCKQARYCGEACQLAHWKAHKADCRRWSAELAAGKGH
jgi:hypothetical protein